MRVKSRVWSNKMSVMDGAIDDIRHRSLFLLNKEHRGIGDTIEHAASEVERKWGAPASILLRLRNREVSDMKLSNALAVVMASAAAGYDAVCSKVEAAGDRQEARARAEGTNEINSILFSLAASLGGRKEWRP
jgi:hypothetical protein